MRYADVNGLHMYYETHGSGRPLVLIHGGLGSSSMFGPNLPALAKGRTVIAPDLQGHGRTADIDRPLHPKTMAGDVIALIEQLKLATTDLMGYSLGSAVALWVAILRPDLVRKVVEKVKSEGLLNTLQSVREKLVSSASSVISAV